MSVKKVVLVCIALLFTISMAQAAYHHQGEQDADRVLSVYPDIAGTKLDHCSLCHSGGTYLKKGKEVGMGSCQWCHETYGYDGQGNIADTVNTYGQAYLDNGRDAEAVQKIEDQDTDGDGYTNKEEIEAGFFPGNASDYPGLKLAPYKIYTRAQLEALPQHTQFMLMNASRQTDKYTQYTGVTIKNLLDDAGILSSATGITVYAPDGWSQTHPLEYQDDADPENISYHVYGNVPGTDYQYPPASYQYNLQADVIENPDSGWCEYDTPSCVGRQDGDAIPVTNGLKAILALKREGANLVTGVLNDENKLDGEGPYRVVVPQKTPSPPDQRAYSNDQDVVWPYTNGWDHNAGSCSRSATIIKVEPLPEGTTDIDVLEAGWNYIDANKIIVYGAISGEGSGDGSSEGGSNSGGGSSGCFLDTLLGL
jgi:transcription elongation factor Elf1